MGISRLISRPTKRVLKKIRPNLIVVRTQLAELQAEEEKLAEALGRISFPEFQISETIACPEEINCDVLNQAWTSMLAAWGRLFSDGSMQITWDDFLTGRATDILSMYGLLNAVQTAFGDGTIDQGDIAILQSAMTHVLGYNIEWWGSESEEGSEGTEEGATWSLSVNDVQDLTQLLNLLTASLETIAYLDSVAKFAEENGIEFPSKLSSGVALFKEYFAEQGAVTIYLGADTFKKRNDQEIGALEGLTPTGSDNIYLGSRIETGVIVHELWHQFNRYFNNAPGANEGESTLSRFLGEIASNSMSPTQGFPLNRDTITGTASDDDDNAEKLSDLFMTAVLDGLGYTARTNTIGFNENRPANARDMECALRIYLIFLIAGTLPTSTREDYADFECQ